MSYQPPGMAVPSAFTKKTQSKFKKDRLCTIESWDLVDKGILVVREDGTNHLMHVSVSPDVISKSKARELANPSQTTQLWTGYMVDARMRDNLPVGNKVVLERCVTNKKTTVGQEECRLVECSWIVHATDPSPQKIFPGLFSVSAYQNNVQRVQHWNDTAIAIDDQEALIEIAKDLDSNYAAFEKGEMRPGLGVQFRVVVPKDFPEGKTEEKDRIWEVIDSSPPFDWESAVKDGATIVTPARPINGDKFEELVNGYQDWIEGNPAEGKAPKFPPEILKDAKIEVLTYISFMASTMSKSMTIPDRDFDPLYKLARTPTRYAQEDTDVVMGRNMGVFGILQLSSDKVDKATKTFIPRDLATRLFANGILGNIQNCIKTSSGNRACVHPSMAAPKVERPDAESSVAAPAAPSPSMAAPVKAPSVPAPSQAPAKAEVHDVEEDPFLSAMSSPDAGAGQAAGQGRKFGRGEKV